MGCVLFTMIFFEHPFKESTKLSIISATYNFPKEDANSLYKYSENLEIIIRNILITDPKLRPNSSEVYNWLKCTELNNFKNKIIPLNSEARKIYYEQVNKELIMSGRNFDSEKMKKICRLFKKVNINELEQNFKKSFLKKIGIDLNNKSTMPVKSKIIIIRK